MHNRNTIGLLIDGFLKYTENLASMAREEQTRWWMVDAITEAWVQEGEGTGAMMQGSPVTILGITYLWWTQWAEKWNRVVVVDVM